MNKQEYNDLRMSIYLLCGLAEDRLHNSDRKAPFSKEDILSELWWRFFNTGLKRARHVELTRNDPNHKVRITEGLTEDSNEVSFEDAILVSVEELDQMAVDRLCKIADRINDCGNSSFKGYMII